jgi:hypothetical protein
MAGFIASAEERPDLARGIMRYAPEVELLHRWLNLAESVVVKEVRPRV